MSPRRILQVHLGLVRHGGPSCPAYPLRGVVPGPDPGGEVLHLVLFLVQISHRMRAGDRLLPSIAAAIPQ